MFTAGLAVPVLGELRRRAAEPAVKDRREVTELTARETEVLQPPGDRYVVQALGALAHLAPDGAERCPDNLSELQLHNRVGLVRFSTAKSLVNTIG